MRDPRAAASLLIALCTEGSAVFPRGGGLVSCVRR